jgi:hypothetical protein
MRGQRIFLVALVVSLLAHLLAVGSSSRWWTPPAREIPFPIEARLNLAEPPAVPPASPRAERNPRKREAASIRAEAPAAISRVTDTQSKPESAPPELPQAPVAIPAPPPESPASPPELAQSAATAPPAAPIAAAPRALRNLPERIALRYSVQSGEDGFTLGQTTYNGQFRDGRYSLVSVTEATGITALFVSGKIIQTSEGRVTANGLQPDQFWSMKGEKRLPPVRFDWAQQRLMLPDGGVELPPQAQDLLSFPFHLAMLVGEGDSEWSLSVTNGRKLREYHFQALGPEQLAIGDSRVETLHLRGSRSGEGSLDVWLAPTRYWLPVRVRTQDMKGKVIVLTLQPDPP